MKFSYPSGARPLQGYTLKRGIGIGGFGEVYFALNDAGKEVALKKIQRNMDIELRGVRQCLNIRHVNLISLWDIRTSKSHESWVVMEYVPGPSLRDILDDHPRGLPIELLKLWFTSIASGVAYLHHRGIVHRDLKPANVIRDDDAHVIKIGDYGLSKFISCNHQSGQTGTVGTIHYMAPEISTGDYGKEVDIYALGVILYELLTGDVPFDGETSQEIMYKHLLDAPDMEIVPSEYRGVVRGCLTKEPGTRYSSVSAMMAAMPWEEFSGQRNQLLALHSVGVFPKPEGLGSLTEVPTADGATGGATDSATTGARIEPILISNQDAATQMPDIVVGSLSDYEPTAEQQERDRLRPFRKTTPPHAAEPDGQKSSPTSDPAPHKKLSKRTTVVGMEPISILNSEFEAGKLAPIAKPGRNLENKKGLRFSQRKRIFAKKVARKCDAIVSRVAENRFATPAKLILLAVAFVLAAAFPNALPSITLAMATVYASWYLLQLWAGESELVIEKKTQQRLENRESGLRQWIAARPIADRGIETLGSVLAGATVCVLLSFAGLVIETRLESVVDARLAAWSHYAWLCLTTITATISISLIGRAGSMDASRESLSRRLTFASAGISVVLVAIGTAIFFHLETSVMKSTGFFSPIIPWTIFFVALLSLLRWWRQTDPLRATRLSLWTVGLCVAWAAGLSQLLGLPISSSVLVAGIISAAVQLAAPWLNPKKRTEIKQALGKFDKAGFGKIQ